MKKKSPMDLGRRERQIMAFVYSHGEATAAQVQEGISQAPSYSAVRAILRILEDKGYLTHEKVGAKYVYRPTISADEAGKSAMNYLVSSFFDGSTRKAVAALLDMNTSNLSSAELDQLAAMIDQARKEGR